MKNKLVRVNFFQRKPRNGFSFSLEYIFEDIRKRLASKIDAIVYISKCYNDGYLTKFVNIVEAAFRQNKDVNHITGEIHFLDLLMNKKRVVLTVLDCGMMRRKTGIAKEIVKWLYLTGPINKARIVTAISEVTKQEIIGYTGCNPDLIRVVPVAVDPTYQSVPKVFNKSKPNILHIGTGANKNLLRLVQALGSIDCSLTIIGKLSEEVTEALNAFKIDYKNEYNIPHQRMLEVYAECDILSFVSTFEGFGMPIIEANAVERVVITSDISSMPEVAGNAACLVNPLDVNSIKAGILKVINDDEYRETLIANGRVNKLKYEPDFIANMYLDIYKEIAE